jgi:hypothetical protein
MVAACERSVSQTHSPARPIGASRHGTGQPEPLPVRLSGARRRPRHRSRCWLWFGRRRGAAPGWSCVAEHRSSLAWPSRGQRTPALQKLFDGVDLGHLEPVLHVASEMEGIMSGRFAPLARGGLT